MRKVTDPASPWDGLGNKCGHRAPLTQTFSCVLKGTRTCGSLQSREPGWGINLLRDFEKIVDFQLFQNLCDIFLKIYPRKFLQFFARDSHWCILWPEENRLWIDSLTKKFLGSRKKKTTILSTFQTHLKKTWDIEKLHFKFLFHSLKVNRLRDS